MTRAERVGRSVALRLGRLIEKKKIERGMGRLHCGGRLLIGGHNNQMEVGVDAGRGGGEGARPRRNVGGRMVALRLGRLIENKKIERGMGRLHSGGRLLIGGHDNQL